MTKVRNKKRKERRSTQCNNVYSRSISRNNIRKIRNAQGYSPNRDRKKKEVAAECVACKRPTANPNMNGKCTRCSRELKQSNYT